MLKVAMITPEYSRRGGIERVVVELSERFARDDYEIHVFANRWEDAGTAGISFHKVRSIPVQGLGLTSRLLNFFIFSRLAMGRRQFDITHCHAYSWRKFDVVTCHGTHAAWAKAMLKPGGKERSHFGPVTALTYHMMVPLLGYNYRAGQHNRVIAISESIKRELVELCGTPACNLVVIPNGVDLREFHPQHRSACRQAVRDRHGLLEDDFVFLFVGNFFKRKGLPCLLRAFAALGEERARLMVVGRDEINLPAFRALASELGVADRVVFAGGSNAVHQYYAASDAFVFPTLYEPFGLVILEAMASGLPVIVPRLVGMADLLTDGHDVLFFEDPYDHESVGARMRTVMESADMREALGHNARGCAERYSWEECASKTADVYRDVILSRGGHKTLAEERLRDRTR